MQEPGLTESSPGHLLRERREERGLAVHEVAASLNLTEQIILALESDDHAGLPGPTFIKGYLRSYARLLGLDAEDLVGRIQIEPEHVRLAGIGFRRPVFRRRIRSRSRRRKTGVRLVYRAVILLLLAALVSWGLSRLPGPGLDRLSDLFPFERETASSPPLSGGGDGGDSEDPPAGALIRLE